MASRPRLVEEGTPIWNEDGSYPPSPAAAQTSPEHSDTKKTKLSTRLVISGYPKQRHRHGHPHRQASSSSQGGIGSSRGSGDDDGDDDLMMLDNSRRGSRTAGIASSLATAAFGNVAKERKGKRGRTKICTRLVIGGEDLNAPATSGSDTKGSKDETSDLHALSHDLEERGAAWDGTFRAWHDPRSPQETAHDSQIRNGPAGSTVSSIPPRNHHETMEVSVQDGAYPGGTVQGTFRATTGHSHLVPQPYDTASTVASEATSLSVDMEDDSAAFTSSEGECRMEVEDITAKSPLVVMDGANVAYYYADAMAAESSLQRHSDHGVSGGSNRRWRRGRKEPDARGIKVAARYFLEGGCRILVVVPAPWFRVKPSDGDHSSDDGLMLTPQVEILQDLKSNGLVCPAPPTDDDDAYILALARREDGRARRRGGGEGGVFVLSNDMFRDAIRRDERHVHDDGPMSAGSTLGEWLKHGGAGSAGPGRISYSFCNMDSMDEYGDNELDFMPNPRHPLIGRIERENRAKDLALAP